MAAQLGIWRQTGVGKPREIRLNIVGENVLETAFDTEPLNVPPHLGEVGCRMMEVMDLRCPIFFNGDHGIGIGRAQVKFKELDTILLEGRFNEGFCQSHEFVPLSRPQLQPSDYKLHIWHLLQGERGRYEHISGQWRARELTSPDVAAEADDMFEGVRFPVLT
jgi:hypothetical protein